jgi:hypothetical protein
LGNFKFGDPYINSFVVDLSFPINCGIEKTSARGTAGAIITVNDKQKK